jgi:hypothetical protein
MSVNFQEKLPKGPILLFFLLALGIHVVSFYLVHNTPIHSYLDRDSTLRQTLYTHTYEKFLREQRTLELGQIFAKLEQAPQKPTQEFSDLSFEFSPPPLLSFPEGEPLLLSGESFSLADASINLLNSSNEGIPFHEGAPLVSSTPYLISSDFPVANSIQILEPDQKGREIKGEAFDLHIEYAHKKERPGYVFKLILTPKPELCARRMVQNYYFLIDRSNSIPRGRFTLNKEIVAKALGCLKQGDTFNILLFDDRVVKLAEKPVEWNQENLIFAHDFLEKQQHGGYFAATDLYSTLGKVLPQNPKEDEMHTAILLSDGDTYLPIEKQRQTIGSWTLQNGGKIALYTVTSGGGNNLPLLELISVFNKGMLLYSPDPTQIQERFIDLVKMIRNPIGKDLTLTALSTDHQMSVRLQPKERHLPHLYLNRPYVVYGSTNRLSDFVLFIQGSALGKPIDLKKTVSFKEARSSTPDLEKRWVQLIAYEHYHNFLKEGNQKHLEVAKRLLQPYKLPMPLLDDVHHKR